MCENVVVVLDFGSQYTHLIMRRIRGMHIFSRCLPAGATLEEIREMNPAVVILSGGPHSVHLEDSPTVPEGFFAFAREKGIAVLGICYGLHLIVELLGGKVNHAEHHEYGRTQISASEKSRLYGNAEAMHNRTVWMSHGDQVIKLPDGFRVVATSTEGIVAAIENEEANIYALQYHPEVQIRFISLHFFTLFLSNSLWLPELHSRSPIARPSRNVNFLFVIYFPVVARSVFLH